MPDKSRIPVIVSATRTPIGKFLGALSSLSAPELGAIAIREALRRANVSPDVVQEVIMGQVIQGGTGQAPARQSALKAGVPATVSAVTINKVCGSGLKSVMLAAQSIKAGDNQVVVAGGQESMSNAPYYVYGHAEHTAKKAKVTRQQQDEFAAASHRKAIAAIEEGKFKDEIVPVEIAGKKGTTTVDTDEGPRKDTTAETHGKLRPAFPGKGGGDSADLSVTAGNASSLNDGASALVVVSEEYATANSLPILARITGYATGATEPQELFFAPIFAVQNLMKKTGSTIGDYDLIEANEAFASQALANGAGLDWDWDRVNVNGGAIALGHPIGASGARVLTTLLYAMKDRDAKTGLFIPVKVAQNRPAMTVVETIKRPKPKA